MNTQALMTVPNFGAIALVVGANVHSKKMERGERLSELKAELKHDMSNALQGLQSFVPSWQASFGGVGRREKLSSAAEETLIALDHMECCEKLMLALTFSECPFVAQLRNAVIERYASETVEGLAEARGF